MKEPIFKFYVLNYDVNKKRVELYNIFNNIRLHDATEKLVKKYLRAPNKFKYVDNLVTSGKEIFGFEGFCAELRLDISWQERARREYEISVGDLTETDINKFQRFDCYDQAAPNIEVIARDVINQYKLYLKSKENINEED